MKYVTKCRSVEAVQFRFFDRNKVPADIVNFFGPGTICGPDPEEREMLKVYVGFELTSYYVPRNHWAVRHRDGRLEIISNEVFQEFYEHPGVIPCV